MNKEAEREELAEAEQAYDHTLVTFEELKPKLGITYSKPTIRRLITKRKFPAPIFLSQRRMAWPMYVLKKWIRDQADEAEKRDPPLRTIEEYRKA
jgi:predicted DNA-binding transcriptional regulator AlpA